MVIFPASFKKALNKIHIFENILSAGHVVISLKPMFASYRISQLICSADQLIGFYMMVILALTGLTTWYPVLASQELQNITSKY